MVTLRWWSCYYREGQESSSKYHYLPIINHSYAWGKLRFVPVWWINLFGCFGREENDLVWMTKWSIFHDFQFKSSADHNNFLYLFTTGVNSLHIPKKSYSLFIHFISCRDINGNTPLHLAAENGYTHSIQHLMDKNQCVINKGNRNMVRHHELNCILSSFLFAQDVVLMYWDLGFESCVCIAVSSDSSNHHH